MTYGSEVLTRANSYYLCQACGTHACFCAECGSSCTEEHTKDCVWVNWSEAEYEDD